MAARLHQFTPDAQRPLQLVLAPGCGPAAAGGARASAPAPPPRGAPAEGADAVLVWWDGATALPVLPAGPPVIALCVGGPDVLADALRGGADHAFTLPVTPALIRAAIGATGRRSEPSSASEALTPPPALPFTLDPRARTLVVGGRDVHLTLREFDLLAHLADRVGECCTRDEILDAVWGITFETGTNTVDVFIYSLRQKLKAAGLGAPIRTVRGVGYRLVP